MVTFTSLVGARRNGTRPMGGIRPLQFETRMNRKNPMNSGMYGRAAGPPSDSAKSAAVS